MIKTPGRTLLPESMQLIAERTAREYNQRKGRYAHSGRRYHGTAIEADEHLESVLV